MQSPRSPFLSPGRIFAALLALASLVSGLSARVVIEGNARVLLCTGKIEITSESGIVGLSGASQLNCFITLESPAKHRGQRIQILIADNEKSNLPKLAKQSERITLRLVAASVQKDTDFLYDSEILDAFSPDAIPAQFLCASELDRNVNVPRQPRPKIPDSLKNDAGFYRGFSKFLVLVDETGALVSAIPFHNSHPEVKQATLEYLQAAKFAVGKKDKKPSSYYHLVSVFYSLD